ncbi:hypothetical protein BDN72DRAFT_459973 [Pluteus cervinus]|uniref:Uncharacterized protein n=1 Tax=Pluteus cervinus TaxID=181527 RepID=A0ACD3A7C5_9AGAR|nr:hypothetical protein BDN72DRAFT_459973 [Pluteus cervinus]
MFLTVLTRLVPILLDDFTMAPDTPPTLNFSGLSKEDAYNKIESEILRLKDHIRSLLSARNSLAHVSSLPNELLSKVFMHCCDFNESGTYSDIRPARGEKEDPAQPDMRLVASWVSRHWRSVALGHRPLWNLVINLRKSIHLDYVRSCAARCQRLFVDLARPTNALLDACILNIPQTTHLVLDLRSCTTVRSAIGNGHIWTQPAHLLQTLQLHSLHIRLDDAKGVDYPKLQSLTLFACNFRWKFILSLASTISKLDIVDPRRTLTIPACVHLLESLSVLSECHLRSCLDDDGAIPTVSRPNRLGLPRLAKLTLSEPVDLIIQLLRDLDIRHTSLEVVLDETEAIDQGVELFSALRESQDPSWSSMRHLQARHSFTVEDSETSLRHKVHVIGAQSHLLQLPACQTLDLSALESLWTTSLSLDVLKVISQLPRLRRVVLESSSALENFVTFMCTQTHDNASTLPFPALQELVLAHLECQEWLEELRDILSSRKTWGFGLQKSVLFGCDAIGIGELARLKQVVDDVEFCRTSLEDLMI